jgi:3-dehydroquinate dehydratase II
MQSVLVINGPNLNLSGAGEASMYATQTLNEVERMCSGTCREHGFSLDFRQSNHEGVLIDWILDAAVAQANGTLAGVVLNAGTYTHTSMALHDAIKGSGLRVIELTVSNIHANDASRRHSWISPVASGVIAGFGVTGYKLAIAALALQQG